MRFQPVLATFRFRPTATIRLELDGGPVVCTPLHRFWRVGQGWTMARDLKPGDTVRTLGGVELLTNRDVRRYVLEEAGIGVVPFQAFGSTENEGWFRLSVGAVTLADIEAALPRLEEALRRLGTA